eukprot:TRINITY_DN7909_c0_g1_i1.p1 TRINITY_DN7909_c0_g1~~TRINITY_DN7909_c0_g1_i1.p1  ORF type:complete len:122 (-),score=40.08 TRINITY_DN7909_c0_g1_i1:113-478(-)
MPNLRIETNVAKDKIDMKACLTELSKAMASTTGKPEQYMVVQVIPDVAMMFGGSDAPCANAFFMCIGKMGAEENKVHAANLFPIITKHLGVPEDRLYILFRDAPTHEVAWKSTTFKDILGK